MNFSLGKLKNYYSVFSGITWIQLLLTNERFTRCHYLNLMKSDESGYEGIKKSNNLLMKEYVIPKTSSEHKFVWKNKHISVWILSKYIKHVLFSNI